MKKVLVTLVAIIGLVFAASADDIIVQQCLFGANYNSKSIQNYTSTWSATNNNFTWDIVNFNNNQNTWDYVKCGGKTQNTATITTSKAIPQKITKVGILMPALSSTNNISSISLQVSDNSSFTNATTYTIEKKANADAEQIIEMTSPAENLYYRFSAECTAASSNGLIQINKITYYTTDGEDSGTTDPDPDPDPVDPTPGTPLSITFDFKSNNYGLPTGDPYVTEVTTITENPVNMELTGNSEWRHWTDGLRAYTTSNKVPKFTLSVPNGKIVGMSFTGTSTNFKLDGATTNLTEKSWSGSEESVTFQYTGTSGKAVETITVTYVLNSSGGGEDEDDKDKDTSSEYAPAFKGSTIDMTVGETKQLDLGTSYPSDLSFFPMMAGIIDITNDGMITAKAVGKTEVHAIWRDKNFKDDPLTFTVNVSPKQTPDPDDDIEWVLVTNVNNLLDGDEVVIVSEGESQSSAVSNAEQSGYRPRTDITINTGATKTVTLTDDVMIFKVGYDKNQSSPYTFLTTNYKGEDGYLGNTAKNASSIGTSASNAGYRAIVTISDKTSNATIEFNTDTYKNFQYNSASSGLRFACYTSAQTPIQIYKKKSKNEPDLPPLDTYVPEFESIVLTVGETATVAPTNTVEDAPAITYRSDNDAVVTVTDGNTVTAIGRGTATITASWEANEKFAAGSATINVKVNDVLDPDEIEIEATEIFNSSTGFKTGAQANAPTTDTEQTSNETGITYTFNNSIQNPSSYLLIKSNGYISWTLDKTLTELQLTTSSTASTSENNKITVYADNYAIVTNMGVNEQSKTYSIEIPAKYQVAGTVYKVVSVGSSNSQFASFTYKMTAKKPEIKLGELKYTVSDGQKIESGAIEVDLGTEFIFKAENAENITMTIDEDNIEGFDGEKLTWTVDKVYTKAEVNVTATKEGYDATTLEFRLSVNKPTIEYTVTGNKKIDEDGAITVTVGDEFIFTSKHATDIVVTLANDEEIKGFDGEELAWTVEKVYTGESVIVTPYIDQQQGKELIFTLTSELPALGDIKAEYSFNGNKIELETGRSYTVKEGSEFTFSSENARKIRIDAIGEDKDIHTLAETDEPSDYITWVADGSFEDYNITVTVWYDDVNYADYRKEFDFTLSVVPQRRYVMMQTTDLKDLEDNTNYILVFNKNNTYYGMSKTFDSSNRSNGVELTMIEGKVSFSETDDILVLYPENVNISGTSATCKWYFYDDNGEKLYLATDNSISILRKANVAEADEATVTVGDKAKIEFANSTNRELLLNGSSSNYIANYSSNSSGYASPMLFKEYLGEDPGLEFRYTRVYGKVGVGYVGQAAYHKSNGKITYSSNNPDIYVDPETGMYRSGEVCKEGTATIRANIEAADGYAPATAVYEVIIQAPVPSGTFDFTSAENKSGFGAYGMTVYTGSDGKYEQNVTEAYEQAVDLEFNTEAIEGNTGTYRLWKKGDGSIHLKVYNGLKMKFTAATGYAITRIEFNSDKDMAVVDENNGTLENRIWTASDEVTKSVTFTPADGTVEVYTVMVDVSEIEGASAKIESPSVSFKVDDRIINTFVGEKTLLPKVITEDGFDETSIMTYSIDDPDNERFQYDITDEDGNMYVTVYDIPGVYTLRAVSSATATQLSGVAILRLNVFPVLDVLPASDDDLVADERNAHYDVTIVTPDATDIVVPDLAAQFGNDSRYSTLELVSVKAFQYNGQDVNANDVIEIDPTDGIACFERDGYFEYTICYGGTYEATAKVHVLLMPEKPEIQSEGSAHTFYISENSQPGTMLRYRISAVTPQSKARMQSVLAENQPDEEGWYTAPDGSVTLTREDAPEGIADNDLMVVEVQAAREIPQTDKVDYLTTEDESVAIDFNGTLTGVEDVSVALDGTDADEAWYNLQGIRMNLPLAPGIYIHAVGATATKVIIK